VGLAAPQRRRLMEADILETRIAKMRVGLCIQFACLRTFNADCDTGIVYAALHELVALDDAPAWKQFLRDALEEVIFMEAAQ
jgi:hypothetical protein